MYSNFPGGWGGGGGYSNRTNLPPNPQIVTRPAPAIRQSSMRVGTGEQAADAGHAMFSPKSGKPFNPNTQSRNINGYVRQSSSLPKHTCSRSQCGVFSLSQPAARRGLAILLRPLPSPLPAKKNSKSTSTHVSIPVPSRPFQRLPPRLRTILVRRSESKSTDASIKCHPAIATGARD